MNRRRIDGGASATQKHEARKKRGVAGHEHAHERERDERLAEPNHIAVVHLERNEAAHGTACGDAHIEEGGPTCCRLRVDAACKRAKRCGPVAAGGLEGAIAEEADEHRLDPRDTKQLSSGSPSGELLPRAIGCPARPGRRGGSGYLARPCSRGSEHLPRLRRRSGSRQGASARTMPSFPTGQGRLGCRTARSSCPARRPDTRGSFRSRQRGSERVSTSAMPTCMPPSTRKPKNHVLRSGTAP